MRACGSQVADSRWVGFAVVVLAGAPWVCPSVVSAQESGGSSNEAVEQALSRFEQALQDEPGLRPETKDALRNLLDVLHQERTGPSPAHPGGAVTEAQVAGAVDAYLQAHPPEPKPRSWDKFLDTIDVFGDFRYRHESDFNRHKRGSRNRERIRLRLGFTYPLDEEWTVAARVTTGQPDAIQSPHQTLGTGFRKWDFSLDRAYVEYRPKRFPGLWVKAGKFGHVFQPDPIVSSIAWDEDVQPEGVAIGTGWDDVLGIDRVDVVIGEYINIESNTLSDATTFVAQLAAKEKLGEQFDLFTALGYYEYTDLTPDGNLLLFASNVGNAVWFGEYVSRFSLINPLVAITYHGLDKPLTLSGEWVHNLRAADGEGKAWAAGVAYGQAKKATEYQVYYKYMELEQDSVVSAVAPDDFAVSTNFRGHMTGVKYQFTDDVGMHLYGMFHEQRMPTVFLTNDDDHDQWRLRVELNIKF